jgi:hypothetical protein
MGKPRPGLPPVPRRSSLSAEASGQEGRGIRRDEAAGHPGEACLLRPGEWWAPRPPEAARILLQAFFTDLFRQLGVILRAD